MPLVSAISGICCAFKFEDKYCINSVVTSREGSSALELNPEPNYHQMRPQSLDFWWFPGNHSQKTGLVVRGVGFPQAIPYLDL